MSNIYARTYQTIPLLIVASIWYLVMTSVLYVFQYYIERHSHAPRIVPQSAADDLPAAETRSMSDEPMVKSEGVHKWFGPLHVLQGIDLEVAPREVCCIIGPSGSGKSTFLRCINHLESIGAGRLWVDGG